MEYWLLSKLGPTRRGGGWLGGWVGVLLFGSGAPQDTQEEISSSSSEKCDQNSVKKVSFLFYLVFPSLVFCVVSEASIKLREKKENRFFSSSVRRGKNEPESKCKANAAAALYAKREENQFPILSKNLSEEEKQSIVSPLLLEERIFVFIGEISLRLPVSPRGQRSVDLV